MQRLIGRTSVCAAPLPPALARRFGVAPDSALPKTKGKLRPHAEDGYQFQYDDGDWFLHIGDTGYRYLADGEPLWQQYVKVGKTHRVTRLTPRRSSC